MNNCDHIFEIMLGDNESIIGYRCIKCNYKFSKMDFKKLLDDVTIEVERRFYDAFGCIIIFRQFDWEILNNANLHLKKKQLGISTEEIENNPKEKNSSFFH